MNANLNNIAEELFGKIRTRFPKIDLGDEQGKVIDNEDQLKNARFFDFDYVKEGVSLGSVSIKLSEDKGLTVMYSNDIAEGQSQNIVNEWYGFLKSLREFARRRLLNFSTRNLVKSNLDKRDYNFLSKTGGEGQMTESKMRGTNRTSFQDIGEAKIIVKHSQNVNYDNPAGRTLHIESIFIENANGERFLYPFKHLNGARALAQHVAHGGNPYDAIGEHVIGLSEELSKLRFFKGYVGRQDQISEAMSSVTGKVIERIDQVKKEIHQLQSATHYNSFVESFAQSEAQQIPEDLVNDWVDKLTIRNFNEALKDVFPYIYKLVGENELPVIELGVDDILGEQAQGGQDLGDGFILTTVNAFGSERPAVLDTQSNTYIFPNKTAEGSAIVRSPAAYITMKDGKTGTAMSVGPATTAALTKAGLSGKAQTPEDQFESFLDDYNKDIKEFSDFEYALEDIISEDEGISSSDEEVKSAALEKLTQFLSTNPTAGTDGTNATMSLKDIIKDAKFISVLKSLPGETELAPVIKGYLETEHPELVDQVTFPEAGAASVAPAPVAAEPAAPVAAETPPAAPAAPDQGAAMPLEQPVAAESSDDAPFDGGRPSKDKKDQFGNVVKKRAQHSAKQGLAAAIEKARKAGMKSEDIIEVGGQKMSLSELAERAGITLTPHPKEIVEFIKSFYDREHGTFPKGETGVLIATEKKFGDSATPIAHRVIETLSQISETHRMRKLAGMRPDNMAFESVTYESIMLSEAPPVPTGTFDPAVQKLQNELIAKGAKIKADGIMGPATQAAQAQFGISPAAQAIGTTPAKGNKPAGTPGQRPTMARDPRLLTNIDGGAGAIAGAQASAARNQKPPAGSAAQPTPAAAPETPISGGGTPMNAAGLAAAQGKEPAADPNAPAQSTMAPGPATGSQAPTAQADVEKAKAGIAAGSPALQPQQAAAPAATPNPNSGSAYTGGVGNATNNPVTAADPTAAANPMAGIKPTAPATGQAAQPAPPPAAGAPVTSPVSGQTWKTGDGSALTTRTADQIGDTNPRTGVVTPGSYDKNMAQGQKNLNALKGLFGGNKQPTQESTSFANDELSRIINLVHHR